MRGLPALPHLARETARCVPGRPADLEELAAIASFDADVSRFLLRQAPQARTVRDAVFQLGAETLGRIVFTRSIPAMFSAAPESGFDCDLFWRHARLAAEYAVAIGEHCAGEYVSVAYVATLLHNVGKLALDAVAPEVYARVRNAAIAEGRGLIEAERRELGVDHTLAGKWLLENWGLHELYVAAAWLHHHPAGALDETHYPTRLIDLVQLAADAARRTLEAEDGAESAAQADPVLLKRLGLSEESLREALNRQTANTAVPTMADLSRPVFTSSPVADAQHRLERRLERLGLLERLHTQLADARHVAEVLNALGPHVREAFHVPSGMCCAVDLDLACLEGRWWADAQGPLTPLALPLHAPVNATPEQLDAALPAALDAVAEDAPDGVLRGTSLGELVRRPGFLVAPMTADGRHMGQLLLDTTDAPGGFTEEDFADLRLFARAAGAALARLRKVQALERRTEEMADAVLEREAEFQRRLRRERLAGIAALAAGAAHEINNPLAVISGRAQMMLNRTHSADDTRGLETIIEQSRRASRILTDLMQFARPPEPRLEPSVISFILRQVAATLRDRLDRQGIRVIEEYGDHLPRVRLDRRRIEQVFLHLIVNAEQAMTGKGGELAIRARPSADRRQVCIEIADTGPGVPPELRTRIFEPFFTTRPQGEGTGLGLAVCHGIIESHGGAIDVSDAPGQGAVFRVILPAAIDLAPAAAKPAPVPSAGRPVAGRADHAASEAVAPLAPSAPPPSRPARSAARLTPSQSGPIREHRRPAPAEPRFDASSPSSAAVIARPATEPRSILVIDDDVDLREVLKEIFQGRGYRALAASDGVEAQALLAGHRVDLVVLDIRMPRQDGIALLRHIREHDPGLPIIVVTALATDDEIQEATELGIRACLHKPFELKRLLTEIEDALRSRHAA